MSDANLTPLEEFYDCYSCWSSEDWVAFFRWLDADDGFGAKREWLLEDDRIARRDDGWERILSSHYGLAEQFIRSESRRGL